MILDLGIGGGVFFTELHTDTGGAITLGSFGSYPDDLSGYGDLVGFVHEIEQHEYFITDLVGLVGGHEQSTMLEVRHIGRIQDRLVLDGQRQYSVASALLAHPLTPAIIGSTIVTLSSGRAYNRCETCRAVFNG